MSEVTIVYPKLGIKDTIIVEDDPIIEEDEEDEEDEE